MGRLTQVPARLGKASQRIRYAPKVAMAIYQSREWIALRSRRMKDADYRDAKERAKPGERLILDHVREIRDGGAPFDPSNTQWLTFTEHQAKTEAAKRQRAGRG